MADRLRRVLAQRWLQTLVPVMAGVALGVGFFFGLGFPSAATRPDVPPQAAVSLTDSESEQATAPDAAELVPSAGDPSAEQTAEEASPFAAIDEPPPTPPGRTGLVTHSVVQDE